MLLPKRQNARRCTCSDFHFWQFTKRVVYLSIDLHVCHTACRPTAVCLSDNIAMQLSHLLSCLTQGHFVVHSRQTPYNYVCSLTRRLLERNVNKIIDTNDAAPIFLTLTKSGLMIRPMEAISWSPQHRIMIAEESQVREDAMPSLGNLHNACWELDKILP